jgi:hypothetical protein
MKARDLRGDLLHKRRRLQATFLRSWLTVQQCREEGGSKGETGQLQKCGDFMMQNYPSLGEYLYEHCRLSMYLPHRVVPGVWRPLHVLYCQMRSDPALPTT